MSCLLFFVGVIWIIGGASALGEQADVALACIVLGLLFIVGSWGTFSGRGQGRPG